MAEVSIFNPGRCLGNAQTARTSAAKGPEELSMTLGSPCMGGVPWPYFLLGISCALDPSHVLFRRACVGFACLMYLVWQRLPGGSLQPRLLGIALLWNIAASWASSAMRSSDGFGAWLALTASELAFVAVSSRLLSPGGTWRRVAVTFFGSGAAYAGKHQGWLGLVQIAARRLSEGEEMPREEVFRILVTFGCVMAFVLALLLSLCVAHRRRLCKRATADNEGFGRDLTVIPHSDGRRGLDRVAPEPEELSRAEKA